MTQSQRNTRRRLHNTVRKTILSYYSQEEAAKIVKAAKKQKMTISNFVASAALREAELVNSGLTSRNAILLIFDPRAPKPVFSALTMPI